MNLRLILPATAVLFMAATSCTPYVEEPVPSAPTDPAARKRTPEEQEKIREQRKKKESEEMNNEMPKEEQKPNGGADSLPRKDTPAEGGANTAKPPTEKKSEIPVARPVPGKPGLVFSPFNNKIVDVKGIPAGRIVADPVYPASEKKHFRVP
jgi:hypothetical protein